MLSIIIPARTEALLNYTIKCVLAMATGEIEVIVVLDGYGDYPYEPIKDKRLKYISFPLPLNNERRKRQAINAGVSISHGEYVCWLDAHCLVLKGFDETLIKDSQDDLVIVPSTHTADDYRYWKWSSLTNKKKLDQWRWYKRYEERKDIPIDEIFCSQGSFFFMTRKWFDRCGFMDTKYMGWGQEGEEVCLTTLLNGGKVVVDKNTWYNHLNKAEMGKRQYKYVSAEDSYNYSYDYWVNKHKDFFVDLINKNMPIPNYPENWENIIYGK